MDTLTPLTQNLVRDFEAALAAQARPEPVPSSPVLDQLYNKLLVKQTRIAKVLGVSRPYVTMMLAGVRPCPPKQEHKLADLLRNVLFEMNRQLSPTVAKKRVGQGTAQHPDFIKIMRDRMTEAARVLQEHERGN